VPFTTGFLAKLYVVTAAVRTHSYALAVIAMLSATIAAAFYLRLVFLMYGVRLPAGSRSEAGSLSLSLSGAAPDDAEPAKADASRTVGLGPLSVPAPTAVAIFVMVAFTVVFGIWPAPLVDFVRSASLLF
jgi:NADH-quinone oxidoreductase subunit N